MEMREERSQKDKKWDIDPGDNMSLCSNESNENNFFEKGKYSAQCLPLSDAAKTKQNIQKLEIGHIILNCWQIFWHSVLTKGPTIKASYT